MKFIFGLLALVTASISVHAAEYYALNVTPPYYPRYESVSLVEINNLGQAIGGFYGSSYRVAITGPNGSDPGYRFGGYGTNSGADINNHGFFVGTYLNMSTGREEAFISGPTGTVQTSLGTLGGTSSYATAINDAGHVVGGYDSGSGYSQAFITESGGSGMRSLGSLGSGRSAASDINELGQVTGSSEAVCCGERAFITDPGGGAMRDLGVLLGGMRSRGNSINVHGRVVGTSQTTFGAPDGLVVNHAFVTNDDGFGMRDLGTLGGYFSSANGINSFGQVVGSSNKVGDDLATTRGFVTGLNGLGMTDLNDLVKLDGRFYIVDALSINDRGQILVAATTGEFNPFGETSRWYLLSPVPEPVSSSAFLLGLIALGIFARRRDRS